MRIAVFGVGGAGGYFGAKLALAGEDVTFIARGEHLDAIRSSGLIVETPGGEIVIRPAQATDEPAEVGPVDAVLVGVKAWQVPDAARAIRPLIGPDSFALPLQNGVEAASQLESVLGAGHVVGGLCGTLSWKTGPGRIESIGAVNFVKLGELDNRPSDRTERLRAAFERAGVKVEIPADIRRALWEKFLFVVSLGGVGAVARAPVGVLRTMPETRAMLARCMEEIRAVALARGVTLADSVVADTLKFVDSLDPAGTTSLQRDIVDGKPSELEAWNGAVVRLGGEAGVETPLHQFLYESLLPQERAAREGLVSKRRIRPGMDHQFTAVYRKVPEGFIAYVEELPGANTQGKTLEEARANLEEAAALVLESNRARLEEDLKGAEVIREPFTVPR